MDSQKFTDAFVRGIALSGLLCGLLIVLGLCSSAARSETLYSYWTRNPYAPGRIQPGFRAPPVGSPIAQPCIPQPACLSKYPPPDVEPPLGWVYGPFTVCANPDCTALIISVGADGLNVRTGPNGLVIMSLANGVPVIPLQQAGRWVLVAPACFLVPTWTWSVTSGVPLSVCS